MDSPPTLGDRIDASVWRGSLEDVLLHAAKYAMVKRGTPQDDAAVRGLELALLAKFPADYREFLMRFGSLRIDGDDAYGFGQLEVFGADTLSGARRAFRDECNEWAGTPDWRQRTDDASYDQLRRAYALMIPVIQLSDVMHQGVDCIGTDGRMHVVDIKSWAIEPDRGRSFTAQLLDRLGEVVVRDT